MAPGLGAYTPGYIPVRSRSDSKRSSAFRGVDESSWDQIGIHLLQHAPTKRAHRIVSQDSKEGISMVPGFQKLSGGGDCNRRRIQRLQPKQNSFRARVQNAVRIPSKLEDDED
jgi:hypothetical protein